MIIALCAGHHDAAKGAVNKKHGLNEHDEAMMVVEHLKRIIERNGYTCVVFSGKLSDKIRGINGHRCDVAFDLHFNAGGGSGCEVLHNPNSPERANQAAAMSRAISTYMAARNRGGKEGWYQGGSSAGTKPDAFCNQTNCPAFIPEPLFIDNDAEVEKWFEAGRHEQLAEAIFSGIEAIIDEL